MLRSQVSAVLHLLQYIHAEGVLEIAEVVANHRSAQSALSFEEYRHGLGVVHQ